MTAPIAGFSIERTEPHWQQTVGRDQHNILTPCDMEPGTTAHFEVCVLYANEEAGRECAKADLSTLADQPEPANQPKPTPRIVDGHSGPTFIGFKWEAGFDYDHYYIHYTPQDGPMRTLKHDDDGTWGYQRIDGLAPDRVYKVEVQGCTSGLFGSKCYGWSPTKEIRTTPYPAHSGPDTCAPGFVWREARPADHVCVSVPGRTLIASENATANQRRAVPR